MLKVRFEHACNHASGHKGLKLVRSDPRPQLMHGPPLVIAILFSTTLNLTDNDLFEHIEAVTLLNME